MRLYIIFLLFALVGMKVSSQSLVIWGTDVEEKKFETHLSKISGFYLVTSHVVALKNTLVVRGVHATDCKAYFAITPLQQQEKH